MPDSVSAHRPANPSDLRMTFGDHLDELRTRIIRSLLYVVAATVFCMIWADSMFSIAIRPAWLVLRKYGQESALQSLNPPDTFMVYLKMGVLCGLILSLPLVLREGWRFVASGLYERERRYVRLAIVPSILLFIGGVTFMYLVVLPITLNYLASFNRAFPVPDWPMTRLEKILIGVETSEETVPPGSPMPAVTRIPVYAGDPPRVQPGDLWFDVSNGRLKLALKDAVYHLQMRSSDNQTAVTTLYSVDFYVSFVLGLSLAFGVAFQLPLVVIVLVISGIATLDSLRRSRGYVILVIAVVAAILTPPDVISQILLGIPMVLLFEAGLLAARLIEKKREDQL